MRLRAILLLLALLAFLSASIAGYLYYLSLRQTALRQAETKAVNYGRELDSKLSLYLSESIEACKAFAAMKELRRAAVSHDKKVLLQAKSLLKYFHEVLGFGTCLLLNANGRVIASSKQAVKEKFANSAYFKTAMKGKVTLLIGKIASANKEMLICSHPVYSNGQGVPDGVLVVTASIKPIITTLGRVHEGITMLVGRQDNVLIANRPEWVGRFLWKNDKNRGANSKETQHGGNGRRSVGLSLPSGTYAVDAAGNKYLIYQKRIAVYPEWQVIYLVSFREISMRVFYDVLRSSGSIVVVLCILVAISVLILYKMAARDIAERKKAEQALLESEKRYRTVLEANPDPVIVDDLKGRVIYLNPAFTRVFGWTLEECLGKKLENFIPETARDSAKIMLDELLTGAEYSGVETQRYTKKGELIPVSISGAVYKDSDGKPVGSLINLRDISEKKKLQAQLRQAQKMEAVGTLAGGIAHDFNNLLQAVHGYSELLLMGKKEDAPDYQKLQKILRAAERGGELTKQLLTFSRKVESKKQPLNLNNEVEQVSSLLERTFPKMIEIELLLEKDLKISYADPAQVEQILMNLALNAKDAMPEGGKLTIETKNIILNEEFCRIHPKATPWEYV
ncbi:MAG: PAS domain S-box protein, partial [Deltaproteobacteria bacterium]|nr:PAS domain S-box protein [Deltaproteobacteria bacterium]